MQALQQLFPQEIPKSLDEVLLATLRQKINSCWIGNVKGFWLKAHSETTELTNLTHTKVEISFLKPIDGAQLELIMTKGHEDFMEDSEIEINNMIKALHDKNQIGKNVTYLEDLIVKKMDLETIDEAYLVKRQKAQELEALFREMTSLQDEQIKMQGYKVITSILDGEPKDKIKKVSHEFLESIKDSHDYASNKRKLDAAKQAYMNA